MLYYLSADKVEMEYMNPHSQERIPSKKVCSVPRTRTGAIIYERLDERAMLLK
jgi:hypothetical protein